MYRVCMRFYEELNDLLPEHMRKRDFEWEFPGKRSVKDLIESFGVPHTEVDLILVNGESVDFSYIVNDGDRISVYPVFEGFSIQDVTRLRPKPLRNPRFVSDIHLWKLTRILRLLGLDVDFDKNRKNHELAEISNREDRILLTRARQLLMQKNVSRGIFIRHMDPDKQLRELFDRLDLRNLCTPFSRCTVCNGLLKKVDSEDETFAAIQPKIPKHVLSWCKVYNLCLSCGKIYWEGTHYDKLKAKVEAVLNNGTEQ